MRTENTTQIIRFQLLYMKSTSLAQKWKNQLKYLMLCGFKKLES